MDGNINLVSIFIFDTQELTLQTFESTRNKSNVFSEAKVNVDNPITGIKIRIGSFRSFSTS